MTEKPKFGCEFCKAKLSSETYLLNHLCEQKRRWLHRDEKVERMAFMVYHHFFCKSMARRSVPTQRSFIQSSLYLAFVRFARHLINIEATQPMGFVDFLLRAEVKIDRWTNPEIYARYIRELNKNETPVEAIERNFMLMQQWSVATGEDWRNFFRRIAPPQATLWITTGRISPWLLFTASSALDLLKRLNQEQESMVEKVIDTEYWQAKIARHQDDVEMIRTMLLEYAI